MAFSLPTHPFQPQAWITADREGGQWLLSKYSNINKFRRLSQASEPTPQPTKMERISASSCRHGVQGRTKIKQPCTCLAQMTYRCLSGCSRPSSGFVKFQKREASPQVERRIAIRSLRDSSALAPSSAECIQHPALLGSYT